MRYTAILAALLLVNVQANRLRSTSGAAAIVNASKTRALPSECDSCGDAGQDPFVEQTKYCGDLYAQCQCCNKEVLQKTQDICKQFMGYGGCIKGIKAAIEKKKADCKKKQAIDEYNKEQAKKKINDAVGEKIIFPAASDEKTKLGPYEKDCLEYSDPSCEENKALCAFDFGCNKALNDDITTLKQIKDWKGMLDNLPCLR
eukprot:TRINITY_DN3827_c0_g1_i1.p1 TRINITY_DN3827_c0_g1~~TRINITY_DN3827_c0_g1_i1.p1  ORF type:complete len:201 (-),score=46.07 TRINITY_DN3827_c0_g1_i1:95-697(-)